MLGACPRHRLSAEPCEALYGRRRWGGDPPLNRLAFRAWVPAVGRYEYVPGYLLALVPEAARLGTAFHQRGNGAFARPATSSSPRSPVPSTGSLSASVQRAKAERPLFLGPATKRFGHWPRRLRASSSTDQCCQLRVTSPLANFPAEAVATAICHSRFSEAPSPGSRQRHRWCLRPMDQRICPAFLAVFWRRR